MLVKFVKVLNVFSLVAARFGSSNSGRASGNTSGRALNFPLNLAFLLILSLALTLSLSASDSEAATGNSQSSSAQKGNSGQSKLEHKVGQMIMVGFGGLDPDKPTPSMRQLLEDIRAGRVGGVVLFERNYLGQVRNVQSKEQIRKLARYLQMEAKNAGQPPLFISVDQEGGAVRRLKTQHGYAELPSALEMGKKTPENTFALAQTLGAELAYSGINVDFAPVLDLDGPSPAIGKYKRAFSSDPAKVAQHGQAFAQGLLSRGVIPVFKHFPGHGSALVDTHEGLADITKTWQEKELLPYKQIFSSMAAAIKTKNGWRSPASAMVMIGHLSHSLDQDLPATLSPKIINGLLRGQLGWQGVVVTDDLLMRAISSHYSMPEALGLAANAGVDILLVGNNLASDWSNGDISAADIHKSVMEQIRSGKISEKTIDEAYTRIMLLKRDLH